MFWNSRDRLARLSPACGLAIIMLLGAARPVAASEIMAAVPPGAAPPAPTKSHAGERQTGGNCQSGQCGRSKQHQPHGDRCEGRCANGNCGKPGCPAQCPVRPDRFGFYGTQWRVWPGQGVVQASFTEAATPVRPPKSEIPGADEESPQSAAEVPADEESRDEESREDMPAAEPLPSPKAPAAPPVQPPVKKKDAEPLESPFADEPAAEPDVQKPAAEEPALEKPATPAAEENLFDEASHRRRRHELLASLQQSAMRSELARQEALRQQARQTQSGAMTGLPPAGETATPSAVRTVAHEEPVPPSEPPRGNPLR
jgi:hypothetical protein